jgi:hypothetical protein
MAPARSWLRKSIVTIASFAAGRSGADDNQARIVSPDGGFNLARGRTRLFSLAWIDDHFRSYAQPSRRRMVLRQEFFAALANAWVADLGNVARRLYARPPFEPRGPLPAERRHE